MNQFKLLCIIPLNGCAEKFRKNLIIGEAYKFKDDFIVELDADKSKITKVLKDEKKSIDSLYDLKNGITVEVSALVGLNGSGKSALIELLYYLIYTMSIYNSKKSLLTEHSELINQQIKRAQKDAQKLYDSKRKIRPIELFKILNDHNLSLNKKELAGITDGQTLLKNIIKNRLEYLHGQEQDDLKIERSIRDELSVALVYETSEGIYSISFSNKELNCHKYKPNGELEKLKNFFFDPFFYSICLNYSHHSLNSEVLGNWINSLFHKNDGYATPVVINPMRDNGNFNINRELHLSNERVMSNLTFEIAKKPEVILLDKYYLKKFLLFAKKDFILITCDSFEDENRDLKKSKTKLYTKKDFDRLKSVVFVRSKLGTEYLTRFTNYQDFALGYIEKKIEKIKNNYSDLFLDKKLNHNHNKFMAFLRNDTSHITKKLRQTINFIKYTNNPSSIWNEKNHYSYAEFDMSKFRIWLAECNPNYKNLSASALMEFALPGFFNIDFDLSIKNNSNIKPIRLSELSSGEQQMIFNINTITYHLYNLQSVHSDEVDKTKGKENDENKVIRLPYKNISIILDEIEIYYHPDMQRELTSNILSALENIKENGEIGIESIHIIFLTHSPFILSDIPSSNILRLNNGKAKTIEQQTFGANIHDLLANDFFLKKGFMGEFAKEKIKEIIEIMKDVQDKKYGLHKLDSLKQKCKNIIDIVGEPILYMSLMDLYVETFKDSKNEFIDNQIEKLEKLRDDSHTHK
ncbi:AAA family ATPase [Maribacter forsetii]|uniref:AAA family ATPase n=1 Tax=Maribacter forsetii TaxID=444515 RepID=UPI00056782F8|nr:AAA family ATPase [Maribacter forsetii]